MLLTSTNRWPLRASEIALGSPQLLRSLIEHDGFAVACGWADPWPFANASDNQVACAIGLAMAVMALVDHRALSLRIEGADALEAAAGTVDQVVLAGCGIVELSLLENAGACQPVSALFPSSKPSEWRSGAWRQRWHPRRDGAHEDLRAVIVLSGLVVDLAAPAPDGLDDAPDEVLRLLLERGVTFAKERGMP